MRRLRESRRLWGSLTPFWAVSGASTQGRSSKELNGAWAASYMGRVRDRCGRWRACARAGLGQDSDRWTVWRGECRAEVCRRSRVDLRRMRQVERSFDRLCHGVGDSSGGWKREFCAKLYASGPALQARLTCSGGVRFTASHGFALRESGPTNPRRKHAIAWANEHSCRKPLMS